MGSRFRKERDNDLSAVGTVGRRTGITLPRARTDDNGIEEITGIFSSPHKPSPLKASAFVVDTGKARSIPSTPAQLLSSRKRARLSSLPRSTSPKKTGINGSARRSQGVDLQATIKDVQITGNEDQENDASHTPLVATHQIMERHEHSPLKDITPTGHSNRISSGRNMFVASPRVFIPEARSEEVNHSEVEPEHAVADNELMQDASTQLDHSTIDSPTENHQGDVSHAEHEHSDACAPSTDDEYAEQTTQTTPLPQSGAREPTEANSRRKRKLDILDTEGQSNVHSSVGSKRPRNLQISNDNNASDDGSDSQYPPSATVNRPKTSNKKGRKAKAHMSARQQAELDRVVERIKERPGPPKTLYVLRRETPADDGTTHTRSGRVSVRPLAYWRNDRCIYGVSPSSSNLQQGARFPLNSIKEIIRTEELSVSNSKQASKKKKRKRAETSSRNRTSDSEGDDSVHQDAEAEEWESAVGIFRGQVSLWDPQHEAPLEDEEEYDLAYAPASMQTREVPGSSFKYAKLLSMPFFGSGIVDLPPGGVKRPKNSRKMHMAFFVAQGRVTVQVGPLGVDKQSRFSVGKGGFWQVPRGNQYSIENESDRPARVFFSQGCEMAA